MSARFRPEDRIRKQADFDRIYQARIYAADDVLVINGGANGLEHARLGLSGSRKGGNAVTRNRWKRLSFWPAMPVPADLQPLHDRGSAEIRGNPGVHQGSMANPALQPVLSGRL